MKKEYGHVFLKRLGKNRLRPGGLAGTTYLLNHIEFKENTKILEIACNKGVNLLELAQKYPECFFVGLDVDKDAIAEANQTRQNLNIQNCEFVVGSVFALKFEDNEFDYILNEAMLTMFSNKNKLKALLEYSRVLKKEGLLLTHDIMLLSNFEATKSILSNSININVAPLPKQEWEEVFKEAHFTTIGHINNKLTLMTPKGMIKDEGLVNTLKIIKNGLKKENRKQFLTMRKTFSKLKNNMNYICFVNKNMKED